MSNSRVRYFARPDGELLQSVGEEVSYSETEYDEFYFFVVLYVEYTIYVEANTDVEYTVEAKGTVQEGDEINDKTTQSLSAGETQEVSATLPENQNQQGQIDFDDSWYSAYINETGVVEEAGLNEAVGGYLGGDLSDSRLNSVISSYLSGDPIS